MLAQRILTAIVMLAVLTAVLSIPSAIPLLLLLNMLAACALWEWLRLIQPGQDSHTAFTSALILFAALAWLAVQWFALSQFVESGMSTVQWRIWLNTTITHGLIPVAALLWMAGASAAVVRARMARHASTLYQRISAVGAVVALWAALVLLYQAYGVWLLLSLMALVWCADIAAYFAGRAFGRHKLAPRVSPGKSWEGAVGGVLAAVGWTLVSAHWDGSMGALLVQRYGFAATVVLAAGLAALSIVGDLYESLLKRRVGVKDSSGLLPGHGGVLDRIDALLPVAPAAFCLLSF